MSLTLVRDMMRWVTMTQMSKWHPYFLPLDRACQGYILNVEHSEQNGHETRAMKMCGGRQEVVSS